MRKLFLFVAILFATSCFGKTNSNKSLSQWFSENVRFPVLAEENQIEGKVVIQITISPDGKVSAKILQSSHELFSAEALRMVRYIPMSIRMDKNTEKNIVLPINFRLKK